MKRVKIYVFYKNKLIEWNIESFQNSSVEFLLDKDITLFSRDYTFHFEYENGNYILKSFNDFELIYKDQKLNSKLIIDGDIIICDLIRDKSKVILSIQYEDFSNCNFYKCKVNEISQIKIGKNEYADIIYDNDDMLDYHIILNFRKNSVEVISNGIGCYLNNRKISKGEALFGDTIFIYGLKIIYLGKYIAVNNPNGKVSSRLKFSNDDIEVMETRSFTNINREIEDDGKVYLDLDENVEFRVDAPVIYNHNSLKFLFIGLIPLSLIVLAVSMLFLYYIGANSFYYLLVGSVGTLVIVLLICLLFYFKVNRRRQEERYNSYLDDKFKEISVIKDEWVRALSQRYPRTIDCYESVINFDNNVWNRVGRDNNFLNLTIGQGESYFGNLKILTKNVHDNRLFDSHKILKKVPITIPLKKISKLAVVSDMHKIYDVFKNFIVQFTSNNSYKDLKIVTIASKDHEENINYLKLIPHVYSDKNDFRYFAITDDEVIDVLHNLRKIIKERESILRQNTNYVFKTSYVVFLFHNFTTPMNQFLNYIKSVSSKIDVHFVIFTINNKDIPECFKYILNVGEREQILYNIRENGIKKVVLSYDYVDIANLIDIDKFTDTLSKIKLSTEGVIKGFESRSIFGLYNASSVKDLNIEDRWRKNKLLSSLNIPVATKNFKDVFTLNIHEKHDGINGIIFGESGVGKTELLKNMILSYSINLSPNLLNFIILKSNYNIKLNNFVHLPHVIDILDKEDISEKNRLIELIKNEISRRQKLFDSIGVKDINAYLNTYENYSDTIIISHLIIIIDDVCENDIDFIRELSQLYSSILSIGIHIIVSSNCVSAFVKEEKILSNFDFKVCFRLSDVRDLFEIMGENEILNPNSTGKFNIRLSDSVIVNNVQIVYSNCYVGDYEEQLAIELVNNCGTISKKIIRAYETNEFLLQEDEIINEISSLSTNINMRYMSAFNSSLRYLSLYDLSGYKSNFNGFMWTESEKPCSAIVGVVDDPKYQVQRFLSVDFKNIGNLFVFGSPGTGKSNLIKTLIYSLCCEYKERNLNVYIVDPNTRNTDCFGYAPHVKNIAYTKSEINSLFKKILEEFELRKKIFDNLDISTIDQYKLRVGEELPNVILTIDSVQEIIDDKWDYMKFIRMIARDGKFYGIYVCITSSEYGNIEMNLSEYFDNKFVLRFNDESLYKKILGREYKLNSKFKGRGIVNYRDSLGDRILEFQVALPMLSNNDVDLNNKLKRLFIHMNEINNKIYGGSEIMDVLEHESNEEKQLIESRTELDLNSFLDNFINDCNNLCVVHDSKNNDGILYNIYKIVEEKGIKSYFFQNRDLDENEVKEFINWLDSVTDERVCVIISNIEKLISLCNDEMIGSLNSILERQSRKMYFVTSIYRTSNIDNRCSKVIDLLLLNGASIIVNDDENATILYKSQENLIKIN